MFIFILWHAGDLCTLNKNNAEMNVSFNIIENTKLNDDFL